jgi:hypothetical protein
MISQAELNHNDQNLLAEIVPIHTCSNRHADIPHYNMEGLHEPPWEREAR